MPDFSSWFYDGWGPLLRSLLLGLCAYVGLVVFLRFSGKRTLAKMNAFDFLVTVALGSTLAATLLRSQVSLAQGLTAFATLIAVQCAIAWTCARSPRADRLVKGQPTIVLQRGLLLRDALRRERLTEAEVLSALRKVGLARESDAQAVVLEATGDLSVLRNVADSPAEGNSTLRNASNPSQWQ